MQKKHTRLLTTLSLCLLLASCSSINTSTGPFSWGGVQSPSSGTFKVGNPYRIDGVYYTPQETYDMTQKGIASWYGPNFHGKLTANGEIYDQKSLTAAHKTLQLPSIVKVTNLENGRSVIVRVNDRGPFSRGRIIDMSEKGAEVLQFKNQGTAKVKLQVMAHESRIVASAAKQGIDVSGVEIALNQGTAIEDFLNIDTAAEGLVNKASAAMPTTSQPSAENDNKTVTVLPLDTADLIQNNQPLPLDVVSSTVLEAQAKPAESAPVTTADTPEKTSSRTASDIINELTLPAEKVVNSDIYIQAGSFSSKANADRYAADLLSFGANTVTPVNVGDTTFYRVRIGPVDTVGHADAILDGMKKQKHTNAIIILGE